MSINDDQLLAWSDRDNIGEDEVTYRALASRAYYSAYHKCKSWENTLPMIGSEEGQAGGIHQKLINRLSNPAPEVRNLETRKTSKVLATMLLNLKVIRHKADYDLNQNFEKTELATVIEGAKRISQKLIADSQQANRAAG